MDSIFKSDGDHVDYTPSGAVAAGDVVAQGQLVGVAERDIAANELGALTIKGVRSFPKHVSSSSAIAAGTKLYWDVADNEVNTDTANPYLGKAVLAATATATTVDVLMDQ